MPAEVLPSVGAELVRAGSRVRVGDDEGEQEFAIVDTGDADFGAGRVSSDSPLGRAVLGHAVGERVVVPGAGRSARRADRGDRRRQFGGRTVRARMAARPKHVRVCYRGIPYTLDLVRCRRALVERQVDGKLDNMAAVAQAIGISRSTASRFFSGRPTSLGVTLKILYALHLTFADVVKPVDSHDEEEGLST